MMGANSFMVDMQISHHQIHIYSGNYDEKFTEWGGGNVEQGAVLHHSHVIFDPIIDEAFKAKVYIVVEDSFKLSPNALRGIVTNIQVADDLGMFVSSVPGVHKININFLPGNYNLYFEECEQDSIDELYFIFTFVKSEIEMDSKYLIDDNWGGKAGTSLKLGEF